MNMNELATASREGVHVIEVVINNHVLGMVRQWQTLFYGKYLMIMLTLLRFQKDSVRQQSELRQLKSLQRLLRLR